MITYRSIFEKNRIIFKFLKLSQIFGDRVYMKVAKFYNGLIFKKFQLRRISLINDTEVKEYIKDMENYVSFNDGYGKIELDENLISDLILVSNKVIDDNKNFGSHKGFMDNFLQDDHLNKYQIFINTVLNPRILFAAIKYCGHVPVLNSIKLLKTDAKKNNNTGLKNYTSSQLYHLDHPDDPYFKVIINISDVCQNSGPFTFIKKRASKKLQKKVKSGILKSDFVDDELAYRHINKDTDEIRLIGKPGTCYFVDSSNCFHRGSRDNTKERLLLMFSYVSATRADFRKLPCFKKYLDNVKKINLSKMILDYDF